MRKRARQMCEVPRPPTRLFIFSGTVPRPTGRHWSFNKVYVYAHKRTTQYCGSKRWYCKSGGEQPKQLKRAYLIFLDSKGCLGHFVETIFVEKGFVHLHGRRFRTVLCKRMHVSECVDGWMELERNGRKTNAKPPRLLTSPRTLPHLTHIFSTLNLVSTKGEEATVMLHERLGLLR